MELRSFFWQRNSKLKPGEVVVKMTRDLFLVLSLSTTLFFSSCLENPPNSHAGSPYDEAGYRPKRKQPTAYELYCKRAEVADIEHGEVLSPKEEFFALVHEICQQDSVMTDEQRKYLYRLLNDNFLLFQITWSSSWELTRQERDLLFSDLDKIFLKNGIQRDRLVCLGWTQLPKKYQGKPRSIVMITGEELNWLFKTKKWQSSEIYYVVNNLALFQYFLGFQSHWTFDADTPTLDGTRINPSYDNPDLYIAHVKRTGPEEKYPYHEGARLPSDWETSYDPGEQ